MSLYKKAMLDTVKKRWYIAAAAAVLCALAFGAFGYMNAEKSLSELEEKREEIDTYKAEIERYDQAIADAEEALKLSAEQVDDLQEYADNAVYMKLDSGNAFVGSAEFAIIGGEGTNVGNVLQALYIYVVQGGLKDDAANQEELGTKYWGEVIGAGINGVTLWITVMQPTEELAQKSIDEIKRCVSAYVPSVQEIYGDFIAKVQNTSVYSKSDAGIVNTQNARRNDLKNYSTNHADQETGINNRINARDNYIENNKPDSLEIEPVNVKKKAIVFALIGLFIGIWVGLGVVLIEFIAGNIIRCPEDMRKYGLVTFTSAVPEKSVQIDASEYDAASVIKQESILMKVTSGKTHVKDIENLIALCRQYAVRIEGAVVEQ